jgi:excisionase family DNA binding protein
VNGDLRLTLPNDVLEQLAQRAAEIVAEGTRREYLDTRAAATYLHCAPNRLHKLAAQRRIPFRREGDRLLFVRQELDEWLDRGDAALR